MSVSSNHRTQSNSLYIVLRLAVSPLSLPPGMISTSGASQISRGLLLCPYEDVCLIEIPKSLMSTGFKEQMRQRSLCRFNVGFRLLGYSVLVVLFLPVYDSKDRYIEEGIHFPQQSSPSIFLCSTCLLLRSPSLNAMNKSGLSGFC